MTDYVSERPSIELDRKASKGIFAAFANHPTAPNLIMIVMILAGFWAAYNIPIQFFPETVINNVSVTMRWAGASPTDVDESLLEPVLPDLEALEGVERVSSIASEGIGNITIELEEGADTEAVQAEVTTTLDAINLPDDADDPIVRTRGFRDSVARILVSAPLSKSDLIDVAETLQSGLVDAGIIDVTVTGLQSPLIEVIPNESKLRQLNITIQNINTLLSSRSSDAPAGSLGDSGTLVRSIGRAATVQDIRQLPVFTRSDGTSIVLEEVASVNEIFPDSGREVRRNFNPGIELVVNRGEGESAIRMNDIVQGYVLGVTGEPKPETGVITVGGTEFQIPFLRNRTIETAWEQGRKDLVSTNVSVETYAVRADIINARLKLLFDNGVLGLLIVMVLLAVFLNLRTAFWVAVGIPVSFAATFGVMYITGQTINMISTFGLLITLGIIVDDAIVVGEHADELAGGAYRLPPNARRRVLVRLGSFLFTLSLALLATVGLLGAIPGTENIGSETALFGLVGSIAASIKAAFVPLLVIAGASCFGSTVLVGGALIRETVVDRSLAFKPKTAAVMAAERMAAPVSAAAITTLLAFAALILIGGRFASIVIAIPLAVMAVIVASLVECFLVLPGHMRHALEARSRDRGFALTAPLRWFRLGFDTMFDGFRYGLFRQAVRLFVFLRYPLVGLSIVLFAWSVSQVANGNLRFTFFRGPSSGSVDINYQLVEGASREQNRAVIDDVQAATEVAFNGLGLDMPYDDAVEMIVGRIGSQVARRGGGAAADVDPNTIGSVSIYLSEVFIDRLDEQAQEMGPPFSFMGATGLFQRRISDAMPANPNLASFAARTGRFTPGGSDVDVRILNGDPATMKAAAEATNAALSGIEGVDDAEDDMPYGETELELVLTERGRALGLTETDLANQVRVALSNTNVFSFNDNGRDVSVVVSYAEDDRNREFLENLSLVTPGNAFVQLNQVVSIRQSQGFGTIRREGNSRQVSVTASLAEDSPNDSRQVVAILQDTVVPEIARRFGVDLTLSGSYEDQQAFFGDAAVAALAALGGIYAVLALVFGSFFRPLVILLIIPMGFVGMIWGHILHGVDLTMFSVIGFLGLSGIIINDSIVLVSTIDRRRKVQTNWRAAVDGSVDRLRAVLLTSATTVGGLMPLIFEKSPQADFLLPTTLTIVYGLGLGTFWVLFLVPALVAIQADFGSFFRSFGRLVRLVMQGGRKGFARRQTAEPAATMTAQETNIASS